MTEREIKHLESSCNCCFTRPTDKYEVKAPKHDFENFEAVLYKFKKFGEYSDVRLRAWFRDKSKANPGFYLSDYEQYSQILSKYKKEDNEYRIKQMEELKKTIPILMSSKKFKKTIGYELENRMLLNSDIMVEARKELEESSTFIHILEIDDLWEMNERFRRMVEIKIFGEFINDKVTKFIVSVCSDDFNEQNIIENIEKINNEASIVGECKIENNNITFFDNHHFYTNDPKDYKEPIINCDNGNFKIKRYADNLFEENVLKAKKFDEKSKEMKISREYWDGHPESIYYYEKLTDQQHDLYVSEFNIENKGNCFYFIDFS